MKYSRDDIDRIKNHIDSLAYSTHLGIELHKVGSRFRACCPFHADKTPSFYLNPETNSFHCFGCHKHGDLITLARELKNLSFTDAIEDLEKHAHCKATYTKPTYSPPIQRKLTESESEALDGIVRHYQQSLKETPEAMEYLSSRGLCKGTIEHFEIGYAGFNGNYPEKLKDIGFLYKSGHCAYSGKITVPIRNTKNDLAQLYGRSIREGQFNHYYLKLPHTTLFNPSALNFDSVYLCESIIDTLTLYENGIENACGIYGTNGLKKSYLDEFVRQNIRHVTIAYDNDSAGNRAARDAYEKFRDRDITVSRMKLPKDMDVNAYFLKT